MLMSVIWCWGPGVGNRVDFDHSSIYLCSSLTETVDWMIELGGVP